MHSVEFPSMVDPRWNMLYCGSKWTFHTVFWGVVNCEWGTTSVHIGNTCVCFIPTGLLVFAVGSHYQHWIFIYAQDIIWRTQTKSVKHPCRFKPWMWSVGQILINLETSFIFFSIAPLMWSCEWLKSKHAGGHSATTGSCTPLAGDCMEVWKLIEAICVMLRYLLINLPAAT